VHIGARVLDRVLDRFDRAKVDRRLDRRRTAADAFVDDADRNRGGGGERAEGRREPALLESSRIDAVSQRPQLVSRRRSIEPDPR
jgi:hypothetical protein